MFVSRSGKPVVSTMRNRESLEAEYLARTPKSAAFEARGLGALPITSSRRAGGLPRGRRRVRNLLLSVTPMADVVKPYVCQGVYESALEKGAGDSPRL